MHQNSPTASSSSIFFRGRTSGSHSAKGKEREREREREEWRERRRSSPPGNTGSTSGEHYNGQVWMSYRFQIVTKLRQKRIYKQAQLKHIDLRGVCWRITKVGLKFTITFSLNLLPPHFEYSLWSSNFLIKLLTIITCTHLIFFARYPQGYQVVHRTSSHKT